VAGGRGEGGRGGGGEDEGLGGKVELPRGGEFGYLQIGDFVRRTWRGQRGGTGEGGLEIEKVKNLYKLYG